MSRPFRARALVAVLMLAAAGCQDYNFNPVGHCLIQPGAESFTLSDISSADVLFVVDDSGSMAGEQQRLADAFGDFVQNLTSTNAARASLGRTPFDFHIAVTTTAVYWNFSPRTPDLSPPQTCRSDCPGAAGQQVCCTATSPAPVKQPRRCTSSSQCAGVPGGTTCSNHCTGLHGEGYCCAGPNTAAPAVDNVPCQRVGVECGKLETHYNYAGTCATGLQSALGIAPVENGWPYPHGDFVGITAGGSGQGGVNPRVLHFDKRLYTSTDLRNQQGFTRTDLENFFRQNIKVGVCGSGQEQGLQAARLALQKALAGQQKDPYTFDYVASLSSTSTAGTSFGWSATERTPGNPASWPNGAPDKSKLVLVFVGDEDDCGSPEDPSGGVVMIAEPTGNDACTRDATDTSAVGHKQYAVSDFVNYFTSLGRKVGAAFIASAHSTTSENSCSGTSCQAGICCDRQCVLNNYPAQCTSGNASSCVCSYDTCGGQAAGTRFLEAARQLREKNADVVVGSICDPNFGSLLNEIADIVKPPDTLELPSIPAESRIAMLRIVSPNGETRKICGQPLAPQQPTNYTLTQAQDTGADWWFTEGSIPDAPYDPTGVSTVSVPSKHVYINNSKGNCLLNPGETWSLDYIGVLPAGGCATTADCQTALGGQANQWSCFIPPGLSRGTCTCAAP